jgi:hypothetical protein
MGVLQDLVARDALLTLSSIAFDGGTGSKG